MAQFAVLLYAPAPADPEDLTPQENEAYVRFGQQIEELGGEIMIPATLQPSTTARTIRGGVVTDGPFLEAKEVMCGFMILRARDLEHAVDISKMMPTRPGGGVEVRPLFVPPAS